MWAIEYHCEACRPTHQGRFFKRPDNHDFARFARARESLVQESSGLSIPDEEVPAGDETDRLRRWGYSRYREMFNDRQLLGLGLLLRELRAVKDESVRHALLTVFSDILRYQNMLCRYDTYALKCQDIFSVHGFPVGLVQCENSLLGIPRVGSGSFRHFVEKYLRAKRYSWMETRGRSQSTKPGDRRPSGSPSTCSRQQGLCRPGHADRRPREKSSTSSRGHRPVSDHRSPRTAEAAALGLGAS
jgi:hypothetical protein